MNKNVQEQLKRYSQLSVALSQASSESQAAEIVMTLGCSLLGAYAAGMWIAKKSFRLQLLSHIGRKKQDFDTITNILNNPHKSIIQTVLPGDEIFVVDLASLKQFSQLYDQLKDIVSTCTIVGFQTKKLYGYALFFFHKSHHISSTSKELVQSSFEQFLRITEKQLPRSVNHFSSDDITKKLIGLQKITSLLSNAFTKEKVGEIMIRAGFTMIGAQVGEVSLVNETSQSYDAIVEVGYPQDLKATWPKIYSTKESFLSNQVITTGKPLFISDAQSIDKNYKILHGIIRTTGIRSLSLLPLKIKNKTIGCMNFYYTTPQLFPEFDRQILFMLARQCAQALDRVISQENLQQSKLNMERILLKIGEGIIIREVHGKVLFMNHEAKTIYASYFQNDANSLIVQKKLLSIQDEEGSDVDMERFQFGNMLQKPMVYERDICFTWDDGTNQWIRVKSFPIMHKKSLQNIVDILQDITDLKQKEYVKEEFISIASHELKTPLTSLTLYLHTLQKLLDHKEYEMANRIVARVTEQTNRMSFLVNDMLDITKMKYGDSRVQKKRMLLEELVRETVSEVQATTSTHTIHIAGGAKGKIVGNKEKLRQAITNLLSNALKYSPNANRINVTIAQNQHGIKVCVTDYGIGIEEKEIKTIFKPFVRAQSHHKLHMPGMGLGLYITQEIIRMHNGKLWVKSDSQKKQTTFCFLLKVA